MDRRRGEAVTPRSLFDRLEGNSDALMLLCLLRMEHSAREEPFAFSARAMAQAESIKDWTDYRRYTAAMGWLVEIGECECVHKGGARKGDVSRYQFKNGTASTQALGTRTVPNITIQGPPSLSPFLLVRLPSGLTLEKPPERIVLREVQTGRPPQIPQSATASVTEGDRAGANGVVRQGSGRARRAEPDAASLSISGGVASARPSGGGEGCSLRRNDVSLPCVALPQGCVAATAA